MDRFNTVKKLIIAPALVIVLAAGSAMAGPRHQIGGDRFGSAMSEHVASRPDAKRATEHKINRIAGLSPLGATQSEKTSASRAQSELGAARQDYPPIDSDVWGKYIYSPAEVSFLKELLSQR